MSQPITRRTALQLFGASAGIALLPRIGKSATTAAPPAHSSFTYCLNMATIRGHNLGFVKELETASKAGFHAVEIWIDSLQTYLNNGGTLTDAKKRLNDLGITVENCIGFAQWIVDDDTVRNKGIEQMKKEMDMLAQIGCKRTAAPPMGATETPGLDLNKMAERYHAILKLGDTTGVIPQLEMWGFSKNLSRANEVLYVAMQTGHPSAKVLLDVFHLYKGGTPLDTLHMMSSSATDILHVNDYPANLSAADITDADRIYPGDGIAPVKHILGILHKQDQPLIISTEVFNKNYYSQEALTVAKTALAKMKAVTSGLA
ncbi:sugar phosphate isomerase/epimerase [Ilyomonas limi]|uniref:Sugar phosphate isomerase/epimerase n=1 Tax=Ilyomonas limi TaxID=2575867 RepID=A0A4U3L184_9BACT|nr:sugar phosphate isomerase/epimerase family protein [Ilyomonas limi]TKK68522.1 sugar phosphate isomerase/epimerase [Ilyomonas limi]